MIMTMMITMMTTTSIASKLPQMSSQQKRVLGASKARQRDIATSMAKKVASETHKGRVSKRGC